MKETKAKTKTREIKLKDVKNNEAEELTGILKNIKGIAIKDGIIPKSSHVLIQDFAGKKLKRTKSLILNGAQYFLKAGILWEEVEQFFRKHITFTSEDFE